MNYTEKEIQECRSNYEETVIAGMAQRPQLLSENHLDEDDFILHRVYFLALKSLLREGFQVITKEVFYSRQRELYVLVHGYREYRTTEIPKSDTRIDRMMDTPFDFENFEVYFEDLKKFRLLREAMAKGIDVSQFYATPLVPLSSKADVLTWYQKRDLLHQTSCEALREELYRKPPLFRKARVRSSEPEILKEGDVM